MSSSSAMFEHAYYIGNYMSGILYGVELVMYFLTLKGLFHKRGSNQGDFVKGEHNTARGRAFFALYSTILLLLLTIDVSVNAVWGELMWINGSNGPGGVPGFIETQVWVWYQIMGSTSVVAMIFMGDALLLYRLFIIYGSSYWVVAVPILAYIVAFSLAIIEIILAGKPGGNFFHGKIVNFGTPYYAITICFNIIVTLLIYGRLTKLGKAASKALGKDSAKMYTNVASMLIESAAPYSVVGIMFLVAYALRSETAIPFGQVWAKTACLSPQLIVLRVATGRAWGREAITQAQSAVDFVTTPSRATELVGEASQGNLSNITILGKHSNEKWNGSKTLLS